jgi:hypothetical protein
MARASAQRQVLLAAAQVISNIATIELPMLQWEELMPVLLQAMVQPEASPKYVLWCEIFRRVEVGEPMTFIC